MKKYLVPIFFLCSCAGFAQAAVLAQDCFDYGLGSSPATWNAGIGFSGRWQVASTPALQAKIVEGLTFGAMPVSGHALWAQFSQPTQGLGSGNIFRASAFGAISSGTLWVSYLYRFDSGACAAPDKAALQVRLGTVLRSGVNENTPACTVRYGASPDGVSTPNAAFKDGRTLLMVFAYPDLGVPEGAAAKGWALSVSGYESLVAAGLTAANLDAFALASASSPFKPNTLLPSGTPLQVVPLARNAGSICAFTVDELKIGTALADVVPAPAASHAGGAPSATGAYVRESFEYAPASGMKQRDGGEGFKGGAWGDGTGVRGTADIADKGLQLGGLTAVGNALSLTFEKNAGNETLDVSRNVMTVQDPAKPVWISLLCQFAPDTSAETLDNITAFFRVVGSDRALKYRLSIADRKPCIQHAGGKPNERMGRAFALKPGATYLLVACFPGLKNGAAPVEPCRLWVVENALPVTAGTPDTPLALEKLLDQSAVAKVSAPMTDAALRAGDVMHLGLWGRKNAMASVVFDEIRFGETPAAVLPLAR